MIRFVATAQESIISVLSEKKAMLDAAKDNLERYADAHDVPELQRDMLFFLLQKELFDDTSNSISRRLMREWLGVGGAEGEYLSRCIDGSGIAGSAWKTTDPVFVERCCT